MWIEESTSPDQAVGEDDRVLVVVASHGMTPRAGSCPAHLTVLGARTVGDDLAASTRWPASTIGRWLAQVPWLDRANLRIR